MSRFQNKGFSRRGDSSKQITPVYKIFGDLLLGVIIGVFKCADSINELIF